ncbi:MAG: hypothetical protein ACYC1C_13565 [Chloroflexota bacterium]
MKSVLRAKSGQGTVVRYWQVSLALGLLVIGAAGGLLLLLTRLTQSIYTAGGEVWTTGKLIANNTVHVPILGHINQVIDEINRVLGSSAQASERIRRAVEGRR